MVNISWHLFLEVWSADLELVNTKTFVKKNPIWEFSRSWFYQIVNDSFLKPAP